MVTQYITAWALLTLSCWLATTLLPNVSIPNPKDALVIASSLGAISALLGYLAVALLGVNDIAMGAGDTAVMGAEIFVMRTIVIGLLFDVLKERLRPRISFTGRLSALACAVLMNGLGTALQFMLFYRPTVS